MPLHHDVKAGRCESLKRLGSVPSGTAKKNVQDSESLLMLEGLGPRTLQSPSLTPREWSHSRGTPSRFPVIRQDFIRTWGKGRSSLLFTCCNDETIHQLKDAVHKPKIGSSEKVSLSKKFNALSQNTGEELLPNSDFDVLVGKRAPWEVMAVDGRTVYEKLSCSVVVN